MVGKPSILVVEDYERWQALLERVLSRQGYEVRTASSYREALQSLHQHHYDLAILDVRIDAFQRQEQGLDLLAEIKEISPATETIVITGYELDDQKVRDALVKYGAIDFISKTNWDANSFLLTVSRALNPPLFATIRLSTSEQQPSSVGTRSVLQITCQRQRPDIQGAIGLSLLWDEEKAIRLLVGLIIPSGMEVYPSARQEIVVSPDDDSVVFHFDIIPLIAGYHRLGVVFEHNLRPIATYWLAIEAR